MEPTRTSYLHITGPQKIIFYVMIAASLAYMVWQIYERSRQWNKGRPIDWKPLGWQGIVTFIFGQRKVQSSRTKSGAPMHMMIFYGFMALLLATTLLGVAEYGHVLGIPNFHKGGYYLGYEFTFDVMGLILLIGLVWAAVRRAKMLKAQAESGRDVLSHDPSDWSAICLLIALTVTGFVLEGARMANSPESWDNSAPVGYALSQVLGSMPDAGYIGIWWFHAVLVAVFFAMLPRMKLKHIVLATISAAKAPDRPMGHLRQITMEEVEETEKIGASEATDLSRWHLMSLDACMTCGRCTEVCPAYGAGKSLNPKTVVSSVFGALTTGEPLADAVGEENLWACTTCNACVEACPAMIRHVDIIVDVRRSLVAEGKLSGSGADVLRQTASTGHAWGQPHARQDWMKGLDVPLARNTEDFEYLFWVGCAGATDPLAVRTTKAIAKLLNKAGVSYACLGSEEACTGDPARRIGDEFAFQEQAHTNSSVFKKYGVKKIVTACPHCLNTFRNEYGDFDADVEVLHHTQLLAELVGRKQLVSASAEGVTYHDPCYLARVNNESQAPRLLLGQRSDYDRDRGQVMYELETGVPVEAELLEPEHTAHKTLCCGAGGGRMWMEEPIDQRPSTVRTKELLATGAKTVAAACPFCKIMLDTGIKQETDEEIRLVDIAELLQEANAE
jgi:Fe-S oxidoreductase